MTGAITVSVALCTHNGELFVAEQLESIFAQTVIPDEIIVSDDGSTDGTLAVLDRAVTARTGGPRVTVLKNATPIGVAANFQKAIEACRGDVIVLSDQDDVWEPGRVAALVAEFERRPELTLLHGNALLITADGRALPGSLFEALGVGVGFQRLVHSGHAWRVLVKRNIVTGATASFRRSLADLALPVPAGWLHDEWLAIIAAATGVVDLTDSRLIRYRQHDSNQVGVQTLTVSGKFGRMIEPGRERNARLLARAVSLEERLPGVPGVDATKRGDAAQKLVHERMRAALTRSRARRILPVLRELLTGRYNRFGRGVADAARDVLQPLDDAG